VEKGIANREKKNGRKMMEEIQEKKWEEKGGKEREGSAVPLLGAFSCFLSTSSALLLTSNLLTFHVLRTILIVASSVRSSAVLMATRTMLFTLALSPHV